MAQGLGREAKEQAQGKECSDKKASVKSVRCSDGKVIGSRRIFAPQFKLQVLDSYRRDDDCKGNQRATARKYGIHRRQIQKWLQVEASLRTSVEVSPAAVDESELPESVESPALNLSAEAARQRDDCGAGESVVVGGDGAEVLVKLEESDHDDDDMTLSKRRSFSLQFKLEVLDAFHGDRTCHGNQRATARKFGINRRQVQKWLGQEAELRGEAAFRGGLYRQRLGRGSDPGDPDPDENVWDLSAKRRLGAGRDENVWDLSGKRCLDRDSNPDRDENVWDLSDKRRLAITRDENVWDLSANVWDLSGKKRRLEVETVEAVYNKRRAIDQTVPQVTSSALAVQETALCLVKERAEVSSSVGYVQPPFHPHPVLPIVVPPAQYDLYGTLHYVHPLHPHPHPPKWDVCREYAFGIFR